MTIETTTSQLGVRCSSTRLARRQKDRKLYSVLVGSVLASTGDHNIDETSEHTACKCAQLPYLPPTMHAPTIYKITTLHKSVLLDIGYEMIRIRDATDASRVTSSRVYNTTSNTVIKQAARTANSTSIHSLP